MPSSRDEISPSAEDDSGKTVSDDEVKLSEEEHNEFKYHLETLPKKMRSELLEELRRQLELKQNENITRNLMSDYEADEKLTTSRLSARKKRFPFPTKTTLLTCALRMNEA